MTRTINHVWLTDVEGGKKTLCGKPAMYAADHMPSTESPTVPEVLCAECRIAFEAIKKKNNQI